MKKTWVKGCPLSGMTIGRPQHKVVFRELL